MGSRENSPNGRLGTFPSKLSERRGHTHFVRSGFVMLQPTTKRLPGHTHFVRSGFLMLWPTTKRTPGYTQLVRSGFLMLWPPTKRTPGHTHFVRSGFLMLWPPTKNLVEANDQASTKTKQRGRPLVGQNITNPLLTKWVCSAVGPL